MKTKSERENGRAGEIRETPTARHLVSLLFRFTKKVWRGIKTIPWLICAGPFLLVIVIGSMLHAWPDEREDYDGDIEDGAK